MRSAVLPAILVSIFLVTRLSAQDDGTYKTPPKDIADMLLAKKAPAVSVDDKATWMLFMESTNYPSVEELARPELKIAGLRINPANFAPSRQNFITNLTLRNIASGKDHVISGLPNPLYAGSIRWSPSDKKIAFTHTTGSRVDLYVIDVASQKAIKMNKSPLNTLMGSYTWYDDNTLLYQAAPKAASAAPVRPAVPKGPTIQENYGKATPRPTFQDLIKSPYDEQLFEFYATTQLIINTNGTETKTGSPSLYSMVQLSPDKKYLLMRTLKKPFSYTVPAGGFPADVTITTINGKLVKQLASIPSQETAPGGNDNVLFAPRAFEWRDDEPSTVVWCTPLDSGLIKKNTEYHDAVYALSAPFTAEAKQLFKTKMRYRGITWGNEALAIVTEGLTGKQLTQMDRYNPITEDLEKLITRNSTNAYANPGTPVTTTNQYGKQVLQLIDNGNKILLNNTTGSSPEGDLPFLLSYDVHTKKADTLWRCARGTFETVAAVLDAGNLQLLTERQSEKEVPNFWIKNLRLRIADRQLTFFTNPYPQLEGVANINGPMVWNLPATCTCPKDIVPGEMAGCLCLSGPTPQNLIRLLMPRRSGAVNINTPCSTGVRRYIMLLRDMLYSTMLKCPLWQPRKILPASLLQNQMTISLNSSP
jgi:dipeptidyl aminopeptidase/acylaminoacyl peptidase